MKVKFLKDHLLFDDGDPMYEKGEIAHIEDDTAREWIAEGIVVEI